MTIVVNFFAGPGAGKSTTMAATFALLKMEGFNAEMAPEYAKERVWQKDYAALDNQIYIFGKQLHRIQRLVAAELDVVLTDSPLPFSLVYGAHEGPAFKALVREVFNRYNNLNIFMGRNKDFNPEGRMQNESEAEALDVKVKALLEEEGISYEEVLADKHAARTVYAHTVHRMLGGEGKAPDSWLKQI